MRIDVYIPFNSQKLILFSFNEDIFKNTTRITNNMLPFFVIGFNLVKLKKCCFFSSNFKMYVLNMKCVR